MDLVQELEATREELRQSNISELQIARLLIEYMLVERQTARDVIQNMQQRLLRNKENDA